MSNLHSLKKQNIRKNLVEIKHRKNHSKSSGLNALGPVKARWHNPKVAPQLSLLGVQCPVSSLLLTGGRTCKYDVVSVQGLYSVMWQRGTRRGWEAFKGGRFSSWSLGKSDTGSGHPAVLGTTNGATWRGTAGGSQQPRAALSHDVIRKQGPQSHNRKTKSSTLPAWERALSRR